MPINDATVNLWMMCPFSTVGRPDIVMLHMCVDLTLLLSGKLIVNCCNAGLKFLTGVPSMMKMDVAPVSAIVLLVKIEIILRYCRLGEPNNCRAVAPKLWRAGSCHGILMLFSAALVQFDVVTLTSSSIASNLSDIILLIWVGYEGIAESNFLHLFAKVSSAPRCQHPGNLVVCIPFGHGSHPSFKYCCAFLQVNPSW